MTGASKKNMTKAERILFKEMITSLNRLNSELVGVVNYILDVGNGKLVVTNSEQLEAHLINSEKYFRKTGIVINKLSTLNNERFYKDDLKAKRLNKN